MTGVTREMGEDASPNSQRTLLDAIRAIPAGHVSTYVDLCPGAPWLPGRVVRVEMPDGWRAVKANGSLGGGYEQRDLLLQEGVAFRLGMRVRVDLAQHRAA